MDTPNTPWRLRYAGPGIKPGIIEDSAGHMVATAVPPRHIPLILAAPAMLAALKTAAAGFSTIVNNVGPESEVARIVALDHMHAVQSAIAAATKPAPSPSMSKIPAPAVTTPDTLSPHSAPPQANPELSYAYTPASCPSKHWNDGTDICADCGEDLK